MQDLFPPNGCANGGTCSETGSCICRSDVFSGRYCEVTSLPCSDPLIKEVYPENGCVGNNVCDEVTGNCICDPMQENLGRYCQEEYSLNVTVTPEEPVTAEGRLRRGFDY